MCSEASWATYTTAIGKGDGSDGLSDVTGVAIASQALYLPLSSFKQEPSVNYENLHWLEESSVNYKELEDVGYNTLMGQ